MIKKIGIVLALILGLSLLSLPVVRALSPHMYVQLLDHTGALINPAGSSTVIAAGPSQFVSVLNSTNQIVDSFGGGGGVSAITCVSVALTSAQIKALDLTPVTIVAAPGAGKVIQLVAPPFIQYKFGTLRYVTASAANPSLAFNLASILNAGAGNLVESTDIVGAPILSGAASINNTLTFAAGIRPLATNQPLLIGVSLNPGAPASYNCGPITALTVANGGAGYVVNDTFTIDAGQTKSDSGDATGHVLTAPGGVVGTVAVNAAGTSYLFTTANAGSGPYPTAHTSGAGNNALTLNVTGVTAGDGTAVASVCTQTVTLQ